jgi:glutamyl/glutaminyl-tRNA synthetase
MVSITHIICIFKMSSKLAKRRKIPQASKKDKSSILSVLLQSELDRTSFFDAISSLNPDALKRCTSQILNSSLDYDSLQKKHGPKRSIDQFLEETNVVFRFAPAPSGELHIGHVVPIILNTLLLQVGRNYGRTSRLVLRIDDTDPDILDDRDAACAGLDIVRTLQQLLRVDDLADAGIDCYNSSDHVDQIVGAVIDSIRAGEDYFYPDFTPQHEIKEQRANRVASFYSRLDAQTRNAQLDLLLANHSSGVIRAKIDPASDNGNLRDPVLIRIKAGDRKVRIYPTYDLVCPLLDLYDSRRYDTGDHDHTLLALRDCNYYDRLDQYQWIQRALASCDFVSGGGDPVNLTSMLTFSRIQIENALLSKRKIKALIESGVVAGWDDPRLFTIPGILRRGMTLAGLVNFYWLIGTVSTSNRASVITLRNFFAYYDKTLSRTVTPIVNRLPSHVVIPDGVSTVYDVQIISYRDVVFSDDSVQGDTKVIGQIRIDIDQILTANLMNYKRVDIDPDHLNTVGVPAAAVCDDLKVDHGSLFLHGTDLLARDVVKINNFKDDPSEDVYGGFYLILDIDHAGKTILLSSISD